MSEESAGKFGPYQVIAPIGEGGMGQVFKARDTRLDRIVALKISRAQFSDRFAHEARATAALNHPHIATLYDVGPDYLAGCGKTPISSGIRNAFYAESVGEAL